MVVNGFDRGGRWGDFNVQEAREFPWIDLCLRQIERHSRGSSYEVMVWDNTRMPEHKELIEAHPNVRRFEPVDPQLDLRQGKSLNRLAKKIRPGTEFIITLDSDSFPIRDGWIENLTGRLTGDVELAGAWRDELLPHKPAYVHPCGLALRHSMLLSLDVGFAVGSGIDVAMNLNEAIHARGGRDSRLWRSNKLNVHFMMGAVYGDLIYHQGAGSRAPKFGLKLDGADREAVSSHQERVRLALRNAAFSRLDDLIEVLTGNADLDESRLPELAAVVNEANSRPSVAERVQE
jgi:hypothetical protein